MKKTTLLLTLVLSIMLITAVVPVSAAVYRKTTQQTNMYSKAGSTDASNVIGTIPGGATVTLVGQSTKYSNWFYIEYDGKNGFVQGTYLTKVTDESTRYMAVTLALRSSKKITETNVITLIPKSSEVSLKSTSGNWCAVSYKGKSGYVKKGYFTSDTTETYVIEKTAYNVKIRSTRSTTADNIKTIVAKGKSVRVYKEMTGGWYYVTYGSYKGFMKAGYFESDRSGSTPAETTKTTTANVNLRSGASKSSSVLTVIPRGTKVPVLGTSGSWTKVTYDGKTGYVSSQYLT